MRHEFKLKKPGETSEQNREIAGAKPRRSLRDTGTVKRRPCGGWFVANTAQTERPRYHGLAPSAWVMPYL